MKKGCLIAVLVFVVLFGTIVFFVGKVAKNFYSMAVEMDKLSKHVIQESERLNIAFSFTRPEGFVLDPARFELYSSVRNSTNETLTQTELYNMFAGGKFGFSEIMNMSDSLVTSSRQVIDSLLTQLEQNKMSFDEYSYINKLVSGVVVAEVEAGNPSGIIPADVVKKINDMNKSGDKNQDLFKFTREALEGMDQQAHDDILKLIQPKLDELFGQAHMVYFDVFFFMFSSGDNSDNI